jgi:hypothetical protein
MLPSHLSPLPLAMTTSLEQLSFEDLSVMQMVLATF